MNKIDKLIIIILIQIMRILTKYTENIKPWDFQDIKEALKELNGSDK